MGGDTPSQVQSNAIYVKTLSKRIEDLLVKYSKNNKAIINEILTKESDFYFTPEECVEHGFMDYII